MVTAERTLAEELAADLTYGRTNVVERDGQVWRARVEPDCDHSVFDEDECYIGRLVWARERHGLRPDGFDGAARKLTTHGGDQVWWQPPDDITSVTDFAQMVTDLLNYGYVGVIVERCEGEDGYGRPIVREASSLWGIDAMSSDTPYLAEVIGELVAEATP
jgi:hypothetical protein